MRDLFSDFDIALKFTPPSLGLAIKCSENDSAKWLKFFPLISFTPFKTLPFLWMDTIWFFGLRPYKPTWKYLELVFPSLIHLSLDFYFNMLSFLRNSFQNLSSTSKRRSLDPLTPPLQFLCQCRLTPLPNFISKNLLLRTLLCSKPLVSLSKTSTSPWKQKPLFLEHEKSSNNHLRK